VRTSHTDASVRIRRYAQRLGIDPREPIAALADEPVEFSAIALDGAGRALPVMHSDEGFELLLGTPSPARILRTVRVLTRAFPAGLLTGAGLLVANPVYADPSVQALFTRSDYHGTVIWAWQQALAIAGIEHQLTRSDLSAALKARLRTASAALWAASEAGRAFRGSELWSWSYEHGHYEPLPFQTQQGDLEADAAQLWSTVFLALERSAPATSRMVVPAGRRADN
jgi:hypothetical protein